MYASIYVCGVSDRAQYHAAPFIFRTDKLHLHRSQEFSSVFRIFRSEFYGFSGFLGFSSFLFQRIVVIVYVYCVIAYVFCV